MKISDLPFDLQNKIIDSGLSDHDKIVNFLIDPELAVKPHLNKIYTIQQLEGLEKKFQSLWHLDEPIPITDLFYVAGIVSDEPVPEKYKRIPIIPRYFTLHEADPTQDLEAEIVDRLTMDVEYEESIDLNEFPYLRNLYIMRTNYIPELGINLRNIRMIDGGHNGRISVIPESIRNLVNLKFLNLPGQQIQEIPESIGNLINLTDLNLGDNEIQQIPESIGNLVKLINLNVSENQLEQIPESIGNLVNLKTLNLSYNEIFELPDSIGNLRQLKSFDLTGNQLEEIPDSVENLHNLKEFYLHGNLFSYEYMNHIHILTRTN